MSEHSAESDAADVIELAICEAPKIVLRVGPLYRFYALEGCADCESRVTDYPDQRLTPRVTSPEAPLP